MTSFDMTKYQNQLNDGVNTHDLDVHQRLATLDWDCMADWFEDAELQLAGLYSGDYLYIHEYVVECGLFYMAKNMVDMKRSAVKDFGLSPWNAVAFAQAIAVAAKTYVSVAHSVLEDLVAVTMDGDDVYSADELQAWQTQLDYARWLVARFNVFSY